MRRITATVVALGAFMLTLLASVGVADAHVTVTAVGATEGASDIVITFRVPTESDTASTTGLRVRLPTDTPLLGVLVQPVPGWTTKITQAHLAHPVSTDDGPVTQAVSEIDWTATGGGVKPGGFEEFDIIAGQLPKTPTLTFRAIQHYSDNTNVSWVEVAGPGAAEPEHPAPTLNLGRSGSNDTTATGSTATSRAATTPSAAPSATAAPMVMSGATTKGASATAVAIAIALAAIGIVLGGAGLGLAYSSRRPSD